MEHIIPTSDGSRLCHTVRQGCNRKNNNSVSVTPRGSVAQVYWESIYVNGLHRAVRQTWGEVVALLRNHWIITLFNDVWKQNAIGKKSILGIPVDCVFS